jgi:deoxyribodipyrimidine photolyase-related protein
MMKRLLLFPFQLNQIYIDHLHINFNEIIVIEHLSFYKRYPYHKKRIALHHSAILHFVDTYQKTYPVKHLLIDDLITFYEDMNHQNTYMFLPNDQSDIDFIKPLTEVTFVDDPMFIVSREEWKFLLSKKPWKMDTIYRKLRHQHQILMDDDSPIGGKFSFDGDNRKPYKKGLHFHEPLTFEIDSLTQQSIDWTNALFSNHPGNLDSFIYPVSQSQANQALKHFIDYRLSTFGDHQDVMIKNEPYMSHALIASSLNLGLLNPIEVIKAVEKAYHDGLCGIEAAEGFIRQVLGWREYIRGVYLMTPDYHEKNALNHHASLPSFYWDAYTDLSCLSHTISETIDNSYNHHIQRLMVLSNYANLIGVNPKEVNDWFNSMYIDSFDWVVTPNVMGMGLYADGGLMSTKPYVSGASYIKKMSNYCEGCKYDPTVKSGEKACPFNGLYWNFIDQHKDTLKSNPRMSMMVNLLEKMDSETKNNHINQAQMHIYNLK